jgi:hypothetical protein
MSGDTEKCRAMGWGPGTVLVGDEGYGWDAIRLTAVGEQSVLAVHVAMWRNGAWRFGQGGENNWPLEYRDWRPATPKKLAAIAGGSK